MPPDLERSQLPGMPVHERGSDLEQLCDVGDLEQWRHYSSTLSRFAESSALMTVSVRSQLPRQMDGVKLSAREEGAKSQVGVHIRSTYPVNDRIGGLPRGKNGESAAPAAEASTPCVGGRRALHRPALTAP